MMMTMMSSTDCSSSSMQGSSTASSASSDVMTLTTTAASSWCAMPASSRLRLVRLVRPHQRRLLVVPERSASFGFAVRGGKEHGIGFFVSHVEHGGEAQLKGLRVSGLRGRSRTAWPAHSTHTQLNEPQPSSLSLSPLSPLSLFVYPFAVRRSDLAHQWLSTGGCSAQGVHTAGGQSGSCDAQGAWRGNAASQGVSSAHHNSGKKS